MSKGVRVCSVERGSTLDGPGIRYVIFLTTCPFRCKFCHNPESWASPDSFPFMSTEELLKNVASLAPFLRQGGVTISGGEPLLHKDFLIDFFTELKKINIHTAIDTCGYIQLDEKLDKITELSNLFLVDIKSIYEEEHIELTGKSKEKTFEFLKYIYERQKDIIIRVVMYCEKVNSVKYAKELALYLREFKDKINLIELLPYHSMGIEKWKKLKLNYDNFSFKSPTEEEIKAFSQVLEDFGYKTKY
ncbi:MAG: radical SAM protein [Opitutales bacterium]